MGEATWYEAFPWIARAIRKTELDGGETVTPSVDLWVRAIDIDAQGFQRQLSQVAELASSQFPNWELGDLYPFIPFDRLVTADFELHSLNTEAVTDDWTTWGGLTLETWSEHSKGQEHSLAESLETFAEFNVLQALRELKVKDARRMLRHASVRITKPGAGLPVRLPMGITIDGKPSGTTFASWQDATGSETKKRRAWDFGDTLVIDGRGLDRESVNAIATVWHVGAPFAEAIELPDGALFVFRQPRDTNVGGEPVVRIPVAFVEPDHEGDLEPDAENEAIGVEVDEYNPYAPQASPSSENSTVEAHVTNPADFASPTASDLTRTIDSFVRLLSPRDLAILRGRVLSKPKATLAQLGDELELTRERIRQLESSILADLYDWFASNETLRQFSIRVRDRVGDLTELQTLLSAIPELDESVASLDMPTWFVFDQFDDLFQSDGVWVAVPSLHDLQNRFELQFESFAGARDFIELDEFVSAFSNWRVESPDLLLTWAQSIGYTVVAHCLVSPRVRSMHDLAYIALSANRQPMSLDVLHAATVPDKSKRSFANQLSTDPRMNRVGLDTWALAEWGGESYVSIHDAILKRVDENGTASLRELLEELPERLGASPNSIRTYAGSWPLETVGDVVRRATRAAPKSRPLERTRGVYFADGGFTWRFATTFDHIRGSGSAFPTALAGALGNAYGQTMNVPIANSTKSLTLRWNGNQATIGTIRELLADLGAHEHDHVAFTFSKGEVTATRLGTLPEGYEQRLRFLLCLLDHESVDRRTVATKIGLPTDSLWHEITDAIESRKEHDLLDAIAEMNAHYTE